MTASRRSVTAPPASEGAQSVLMFGQFNGDPNGNTCGIFQAVPASAGEEWTASADVYNDPSDPIGVGNEAFLSLVFRDAGGNVLSDKQCTSEPQSVDVMAGEDYGGVASELFYEGN